MHISRKTHCHKQAHKMHNMCVFLGSWGDFVVWTHKKYIHSQQQSPLFVITTVLTWYSFRRSTCHQGTRLCPACVWVQEFPAIDAFWFPSTALFAKYLSLCWFELCLAGLSRARFTPNTTIKRNVEKSLPGFLLFKSRIERRTLTHFQCFKYVTGENIQHPDHKFHVSQERHTHLASQKMCSFVGEQMHGTCKRSVNTGTYFLILQVVSSYTNINNNNTWHSCSSVSKITSKKTFCICLQKIDMLVSISDLIKIVFYKLVHNTEIRFAAAEPEEFCLYWQTSTPVEKPGRCLPGCVLSVIQKLISFLVYFSACHWKLQSMIDFLCSSKTTKQAVPKSTCFSSTLVIFSLVN